MEQEMEVKLEREVLEQLQAQQLQLLESLQGFVATTTAKQTTLESALEGKLAEITTAHLQLAEMAVTSQQRQATVDTVLSNIMAMLANLQTASDHTAGLAGQAATTSASARSTAEQAAAAANVAYGAASSAAHIAGQAAAGLAAQPPGSPAPPQAGPSQPNVTQFQMNMPSGVSVNRPVQVVAMPDPFRNAPLYNGADPIKESMSAVSLIHYMEGYKMMSSQELTELELVNLTTSRFIKNGHAWTWWQEKLAAALQQNRYPYAGWADFKAAFLGAMLIPDESFQLRNMVRKLRMAKDDDLQVYVSQLRNVFLRLETMGSPMNQQDQLFVLSDGITPRLCRAFPTAAGTTFEGAVAVLTTKLFQNAQRDARMKDRKLQDRDYKSTRKEHLYNVAADDSEDGYDPAGAQYDPYGSSSDEGEDLNYAGNDGNRVRGRGGRGNRGKGRGRGRGYGRGRGRGRGASARPKFTEEQQNWYDSGKCIKCGADGHFARECPTAQHSNK